MIRNANWVETDIHQQEFPEQERYLFDLVANRGDIHKFITGNIPAHWHNELEIFMLMVGSVRIGIGDTFYDDFNSVDFKSLKGYKCIISLKYKERMFFIYRKNELYYMCESKGYGKFYDLNTENDQKRFFNDYIMKLRDKTINKQMFYSKFSMYDLIINYKNYFKI